MRVVKRTLSDSTKDLMHQVIDNNQAALMLVYQIARYKKRDNILKWLNLANIRGNNLVEWVKITHDNSILGMVKFIQMHHNKDKEVQPLILGKDWVK